MKIDIPAVVRAKALAADAGAWLDALPALLADLRAEWQIELGAPFPDATEAYVAEATQADGTPAVLKVLVPRDGDAARHEITVLRLAGGDGCVTMLRDDANRNALLLERLGPSLHDLGLPLRRRLEILADVAAHVWRPAADADLPTGAAKGRWLAEHIVSGWEELDRPCSEAAVEYALACAHRRIAAHDDERAVLVHGDVHEWNAMQAGLHPADGFKLVDPDGLLAEAEYDLGVLMREDPVDLLTGDPHERARWLAARTGSDATAVWEWGVVERVSTGLLCVRIGLEPIGGEMLRAADHVSR